MELKEIEGDQIIKNGKKKLINRKTNFKEAKTEKEKKGLSSDYITMSTKNYFWVLHYLTNKDYETIKSYNINISLDDETLTTC